MIIHGDSKLEKKHKLYKIWAAIKQRCNNKNHSKYKYYGGKGIKYDPRWEYYIAFKEDMFLKYLKYVKLYGEENISIERINSNQDYAKENCTFVHKFNQNGNTSKTKWFIAINIITKEKIKEKNQRKFAREHNLCSRSISRSLKGLQKGYGGWDFKYI